MSDENIILAVIVILIVMWVIRRMTEIALWSFVIVAALVLFGGVTLSQVFDFGKNSVQEGIKIAQEDCPANPDAEILIVKGEINTLRAELAPLTKEDPQRAIIERRIAKKTSEVAQLRICPRS